MLGSEPVPLWARCTSGVVVGFVGVVLASTVFAWFALGPLRPEPVLVVAVAAGFRLPMMWAAAVVGVVGFMADVASGGVVGLQLGGLMVVMLLCAAAERKLEISSVGVEIVGVGLMSLVYQGVVLEGLVVMGRQAVVEGGRWGWIIPAQAVLDGLTAPVFFWMMEVLERFLARLGRLRRR